MTKTIQNKVMDIAELARWMIIGFIALTSIMWILNINGYQEVNGLFGLVGLIVVIFVAIKPKIIGSSMILGGVFAFLNNQDKTQGIAKGPLWLYHLVMVVLYGFLLLATILASWSFEENAFAFWGLFLVIVALVAWQQIYGSNSKWARKIPYFYLLACVIALLWSTFGGAYTGKAFDPVTGNALYMVDPITGNIDSLKRTPAECKAQECFSAETGQRLRAMTADEAIRRNPFTAPGAYVSDAATSLQTAATSIGGKTAETTTTKSSCLTSEIQVQRLGTSVAVKKGCSYTLDLSLVPEGPMLDLEAGNPATEGMSSNEFYSFRYFYRNGVLKGRVTAHGETYYPNGRNKPAVPSGFTSTGLPEVTAFFYPRG